MNLVRPGAGMRFEQRPPQIWACRKAEQSFGAILEHTFPSSIIDAMARGEVLQIVVFSFLFGAACASVGRSGQTGGRFLRIAGRGDVPLHALCDAARAVRGGRGDGGHRRIKGHRCAVRARQADRDDVRCAQIVFVVVVLGAVIAAVAHSAAAASSAPCGSPC